MTGRRVAELASLLVLALLAAACGGGSSPTSPGGQSLAELENNSFLLVNMERSDESVPPTRSDPDLSAIARQHSVQMRDEGFFSHTSPDGQGLLDRLQEAGYPFSFAGENLAKVSNSGNPVLYAHTLLMQNPDHRHNILDERFKVLGVGIATRGDTVWITQIFVR